MEEKGAYLHQRDTIQRFLGMDQIYGKIVTRLMTGFVNFVVSNLSIPLMCDVIEY